MSWTRDETAPVLRGRSVEPLEAASLDALLRRYREVTVDLGTGDGRHVLRRARAAPDTLVVGIDPVADAMADSARKAARKPARGGAENALFLVASLERLPAVLRGRATNVTINYPWGSLLRAVAQPKEEGLRTIVELLQPGATVVALLNASAGEREVHAARLELPPLEDPGHVERELVPGWERAGLEDVRWRMLDPGEDPPARTTWGQRLVRGSGRSTLLVSARTPSASTAS